jgi:hypothetical protein
MPSAQERQKVHSNEQIMASRESGGRSMSQHSQPGFSKSMLRSRSWICQGRADRDPVQGKRIAVLNSFFSMILPESRFTRFANPALTDRDSGENHHVTAFDAQ